MYREKTIRRKQTRKEANETKKGKKKEIEKI